MSIGLLEDPEKTPDILDDLEALFWTFSYCALHTAKHIGDFDMDIFHFYRRELDEHGKETGRVLGGKLKKDALGGQVSLSVAFKSEPLQDLFEDLSGALDDYYYAAKIFELERVQQQASRQPAGVAIAQERLDEQLECTAIARERLNEQHAIISAPLFWMEKFQTALDASEWHSDDGVVYPSSPGIMVEYGRQAFEYGSRILM